jgi:hypothetical protein
MSSFTRITRNPRTGEFEEAEWLDDHFGPHHYGVRFPSGEIFNQRDHAWQFPRERYTLPVPEEKP